MKGRKDKLILEFTEFNAQRLNPDSVQAAQHVDNPQLSTNAFDKHEDLVRQAISRLGQIQGSLGSSAYKTLKSKLSLEHQDVKSLKIIRIVKNQNLNYDAFISFQIDDKEYWGVVKDITKDPKFKSEVFKDDELIQTKEWTIKLQGLIIKNILSFLKPKWGIYKQLKDEVICYSALEGKMLKMVSGTEIEVLKSYDDRIIFKHEGEKFTLTGDNFIYFNWWFEKIED
jgi:hypothetical protein